VLQAPIGHLEAGGDQDNLGHSPALLGRWPPTGFAAGPRAGAWSWPGCAIGKKARKAAYPGCHGS
jgi:hypothetical protein